MRKSGPAGTHAQGSISQFWLSVSFPVGHQQSGGSQAFKEPNRQSFPPQFCSAGSPGIGGCRGGEQIRGMVTSNSNVGRNEGQ